MISTPPRKRSCSGFARSGVAWQCIGLSAGGIIKPWHPAENQIRTPVARTGPERHRKPRKHLRTGEDNRSMNASVNQTEDLLFSVLLQLILMIGVARLMNTVARRFGQPGVIGETIAGLLLGPSLAGHFFPELSQAVFGAKASAP